MARRRRVHSSSMGSSVSLVAAAASLPPTFAIGHPAAQGEAPADDVVEASAGVAAADLALQEEVAGGGIAVEEQAGADRGRRELWRDARLARGGDHRGVAGARLLRIRHADHLAE